MYYIVFTMYQLYRHQIKTVQIAFHFNIYLKVKVTLPIPTHYVRFYTMYLFTVKKFIPTSQPPSP